MQCPLFTTPTTTRIRHAILFLAAIILVPACDGDDALAPGPSVSGRVVASVTGDPVVGAEVSIGSATATTGPNGQFQLAGLPAGPATLRCLATGFEDFEAAITVPPGTLARDVQLTRIETFEFETFSLHVPATVSRARAILVAFGGPDTRGFASGAPFGAPIPEVEASLQVLGERFRGLAASHEIAVLGTSLTALPNGPENDELLVEAIAEAATRSGRAELANAPILLYGMSGGAPQAAGFTARNPGLVAGLFLKVPAGVEALTTGGALEVPTYVVLAELDAFVDNAVLAATAGANRSAGAPWALAMESGVPHHSLSPSQRILTTNWMGAILELRLGDEIGDPLHAIAESTGWLGDPADGAVASWSAYPGDPRSANWFPSQATAEDWKAFVAGQILAEVP